MSGNTLCIRTAVDSRWRLEALRTVMGSLKLLLKRVVKNEEIDHEGGSYLEQWGPVEGAHRRRRSRSSQGPTHLRRVTLKPPLTVVPHLLTRYDRQPTTDSTEPYCR